MRHLFLLLGLALLTSGSGAAIAQDSLTDEGQAKELKRQGVQFQSHGQLVKAIDMYQKAIDINPQDPSCHNNLGLALKDMDLLDDAEGQLRAAIQLKPEDANYHYNLGIVLMRRSNLPEAEKAFQQAIDLKKGDPEFLFRMAQVEMLQGKTDTAEKAIRDALAYQPNDPVYSELLGDILLRQMKTEEAQGAYRKAAIMQGVKRDPVLNNKLEYAEYLLQNKNKANTPVQSGAPMD